MSQQPVNREAAGVSGTTEPANSYSSMPSAVPNFIDLHQLIAIARRRLTLAAIVSGAVFSLAILIILQLTPIYTGTVELIVDPRQQQVVDIESVLSGLPPDSAVVDTEVQIIGSHALAARLVEDLDLMADGEWNSQVSDESNGPLSWIRNAGSAVFGLLRALVPSEAQQLQTPEDMLRTERESTINTLRNAVEVRRSGLTHVILVSVKSERSEQAALLANGLADLYLVDQLEAQFEATELANNWLSDRLGNLAERVQAGERAVELYRAEEGLLDANGTTLTQQQIIDLNGQLIILRADLTEREARLAAARRQLSGGGNGEAVIEVLSSDVVRDLRNQQSEVLREKADLSSRYGDRHPEIQRVQREIADLGTALNREIRRIVSGLESEVSVARQQLSSLESSVENQRGELIRNNTAMVRLRELQREAETDRALYDSFLTRFKQTNEAASLQQADARIISRASIPINPSFPSLSLAGLLALMLAGMAGTSAVFIAEMLETGLRGAEDVERELGMPLLTSIPKLPKERASGRQPADYIAEVPLSGFAEAFRALRASVTYSNLDRETKTVIVTSALPNEGKTAAAHCLAQISQLLGAKTILLDCDLRRHILTQNIGEQRKFGLLEVLAGEIPLDNALITDPKTGLDILPVASAHQTPRDVFGSDQMQSLQAQLRTRYDFIVIDTAPLLAVTETRTLAATADAVIMLARWNKTHRKAVKSAVDILTAAHAPIAGVALSLVDMDAQGRYGNGDTGYFYNSYKNYYAEG